MDKAESMKQHGFKVKERLIEERINIMDLVNLSCRKVTGFCLYFYLTKDCVSPYIIKIVSNLPNIDNEFYGFDNFNDAIYYYINSDIDLKEHFKFNFQKMEQVFS